MQHLVTTVTGRLRPDVDAFDLLAAAFPGGSITGAPKIRAMQLIERLEPVRRGPYCGAMLWLGPDGRLGSSILIRTFVADLNAKETVVHPEVISFTADSADGINVDVALQWNEGYHEQIVCFTNTIKNRDGGTHLTGFRQALTRTINAYAGEYKLLKDEESSTG